MNAYPFKLSLLALLLASTSASAVSPSYVFRVAKSGLVAPASATAPDTSMPAPAQTASWSVSGTPQLQFADTVINPVTAPTVVLNLTNSGQAVGSFAAPAFTGPNAADFTASSNCSNVSPAGNCALTISFRPTSVGAKSASLAVGASSYTYTGNGVSNTTQLTQYAGYRAWSNGTYARNCNEYLNPGAGYAYAGSTGNGVYKISIGGTPTLVACDMTTSGGGWTKVVGVSATNRNHILTTASAWSAAVGTGSTVGAGGETGKLSDADINALKSSSSSTTIAYLLTSSGVTSYFPGSCVFAAATTASGDCSKYTNTYAAAPTWTTGATTSDGCSPPTYYTGLSSIKHSACNGTSLAGSGDLIYGRVGNAPTNGMNRGTPYTGGLAGELWVR